MLASSFGSFSLSQPDAPLRWAALILLGLGALITAIFVKKVLFRFAFLVTGRGADRGRVGLFEGMSATAVGLVLLLTGLLLASILLNVGALLEITRNDRVAELDVFSGEDGRLTVYYTPVVNGARSASGQVYTLEPGEDLSLGGEIVVLHGYLRLIGMRNRYHLTFLRTENRNSEQIDHQVIDNASEELRRIDAVEDTFPYSLYIQTFNKKSAGKPLEPGRRYVFSVTTDGFQMEKEGAAAVPDWARDRPEQAKKNTAE
ncbi:MAG: hypothetical protein HY719_14030 [Planctomycetes bacterium]|nr:hypothetical protein [Planctomycetota bacterium]